MVIPRFEQVHLPLSEWEGILEGFQDRTIFQTSEWLSFLIKTQRAYPVLAALKQGNRTLGFFSGIIVKRLSLRILGSPLPGSTTSYMGFNLLPDVPRGRAVEALLRFAFTELGCVHIEIMDRNLTIEDVKDLGLSYRNFQGFEIDLTQSGEKLLANMTSSCRRCIRRAEKSGVTIEEAADMNFADDYYDELKDVFRKQSLVPTYGLDRVQHLIACLGKTGKLLLLRARAPDGQCIATGIFPALNRTMYFWGGGSWRSYQHLRPNEAIQWYAMRYWKARGMCLYDMGGAGEYKRKFGGHEINVPWLRRSKYPWISALRTLAKQAVYARQRVIGKAFKSFRPQPLTF